ncbi:MAG TPA: ABC transporter permease [Candidatus Limnocylindria bacterium]|jgi:peptide/nickel transport system permease protein|nr:ABC transporter permease [Candidatus Limnocylindria bacterium]
MLLYVVRRLLQTVPLLLVISALIFTLLYLMPGDPLYRMLEGIPNLRPQDFDRLRKLYGFDDPVYIQYGKWLWQLLQLNPGYSREYGQPVFDIILPALKNTLVLTIAAVVLGKIIAIALGIFSAIRQYSIADYILTATTFVAYSVPAFWLGLMLIILFSVKLGWLPTSGIVNSELEPGSWAATVDWMQHLILPVAVLAISEIIQVQRFMRSSLLEVLRQDYLTTARAKGLRESVVIGRHALKNALIPVVTIIAVTMPRVVGGSTVVETVFAYPGMGRLLYTSIMGNDYVVAMTVVMIIAVTVVFFNLLADVIYGWLDPRIRYRS